MTERYTITACPPCKKHDFFEKTDNPWICLSCGYSRDTTRLGSNFNRDSSLFALVIAALVLLVLP